MRFVAQRNHRGMTKSLEPQRDISHENHETVMGANCPHTPGYDERPPPRRTPRGGFSFHFPWPEIAPPCPARGLGRDAILTEDFHVSVRTHRTSFHRVKKQLRLNPHYRAPLRHPCSLRDSLCMRSPVIPLHPLQEIHVYRQNGATTITGRSTGTSRRKGMVSLESKTMNIYPRRWIFFRSASMSRMISSSRDLP